VPKTPHLLRLPLLDILWDTTRTEDQETINPSLARNAAVEFQALVVLALIYFLFPVLR
jgi:hypothetical protein